MTVNETSPAPKRLTKIETQLRTIALAFPEASEEFPWGHRAFKVRRKSFAFVACDADGLRMSVKLPSSGSVALDLPFASPTGYGLGRSGWVTASFGPRDKVPLPILEQWIEESYRAIAPKRLVAALDGHPAPPRGAGASRDRTRRKTPTRRNG